MNVVLQANIVRDCGGYLVAPSFPEREAWNAMLAKYSPGCGSPTHVMGTNGGTMPCGGELTDLSGKTERYFCYHCDLAIAKEKSKL